MTPAARALLVPAVLAAALGPLALGCSMGYEGSLSVYLYYGDNGALPAAPGARIRPAAAPPAYPTAPQNRILVRVLGPHLPAPMEAWFERSAGRGEIRGIPPGSRIAVEVDEYDNTAAVLGTAAPLLGRGWAHGISLAPGETKMVGVTMHDKGTIVRVCGAPPSGGAGTAGDGGDGGLASDASLGQPLAVAIGPGDVLYVSSAMYNRVRRVDRYGYIAHFAGNGPPGPLTDGQPAAEAPIGAVFDIDVDDFGNAYVITLDQQIVRIDEGNGLLAIRYDAQKGNFNTAAKPDLAVAGDDAIYYTNGMENRVYLVRGGVRTAYVSDNTPWQTGEGADKDFYPLRYPAGVSYNFAGPFLYFAERDNHRVTMVNVPAGTVWTRVGSSSPQPFADGIDPLMISPDSPLFFAFDKGSGASFYRERDAHRIRIIRLGNAVYNFAGTGTAGYAGDGGPAALAQLNNPLSAAVDARGNVYVADADNHAVRMVVGGALP